MSHTCPLQETCRLAGLKLTKDEALRLDDDLKRIFAFVEELTQVDTRNVPPLLTPFDEPLRMRQDIPKTDTTRSDILATAPQKDETFFLIPKFVNS